MDGGRGRKRPNVLLLVLDCVRASDFPGGADPVPGMRQVDALVRESVHYPRAASVAHWTVPAHASMFTGRYPWEHGVHAKGTLRLGADVASLGDYLRSSGYRTMSVSANGLISPALGLVRGLDRAAWGSSLFNRLDSGGAPPAVAEEPGSTSAEVGEGGSEARKRLRYWAAVVLARYPFVWDYTTSVASRILHAGNGFRPLLSHWLEPTLGRWLAAEPADRPLYCFINLLDAHEPYLSDPYLQKTAREWLDYARTRQDRLGWVTGKWTPTAQEFRLLHRLYRGMIRVMDDRIGEIVRAFQASGRWDDTLLILTSDHGQAFGDHGSLFHILGVDEAELRVPLFVRPPGGATSPQTAKGWASLIDVFPTVLSAAGIPVPELPSSPVALETLIDEERRGPVFALSDGIVHDPDRAQVPRERRDRIDRILVAGYSGSNKVVADPLDGSLVAYDIDSDPAEKSNRWPSPGTPLEALGEETLALGRRILRGEVEAMAADVEDRLRSWGYL